MTVLRHRDFRNLFLLAAGAELATLSLARGLPVRETWTLRRLERAAAA